MAIDKLNGWLSRTIPQVYSENMSYLELLQAVFNKLDEVIDETNAYFSETYIADHVNTKLAEWELDGTLENLINVGMIGTLGELETNYKDNLVGAINENRSRIVNIGINVKFFGASGDGMVDDTPAIQSAIDYARDNKIKSIIIPNGVYVVQNVNLYSDIHLTGEKDATLKMKSGTMDGYLIGINQNGEGTTDPSLNSRNIKFSNLRLEGRSVEDGFQEHRHLLSLMAVSDVVIENCEFIGNQGDGIYLGGGPSGIERHNERVVIRNCTFDGVNNQNRNGISVIDGTDVIIENNTFKNMSRSDMPGAIDIEPNSTSDNYFILKGIKVKGNTFTNCGGNNGLISLLVVNAHLLYTPVYDIEISGNHTEDTGLFMSVNLDGYVVDDTTPTHAIRLEGNTSKNANPFIIKGVKGLTVSKNHFTNYDFPTLGDYSVSVNGNCLDVSITENIFTNAKSNVVMKIGKVNSLKITDNIFDRSLNTGTNYVLTFNTDAENTTVGLLIANNIVRGNFTDFYRGINHTIDFSSLKSKNNLLDLTILNSINNYDTTLLPNDFPVGETISVVSGDLGLPNASQQGTLKTIRASGSSVPTRYMVQFFYPANNSTTELNDMYYRKGDTSLDQWTSFVKVTGV